MKLIDRAQVLDHQAKSLSPCRQPHAINWRYQIPGGNFDLLKFLPMINPRL